MLQQLKYHIMWCHDLLWCDGFGAISWDVIQYDFLWCDGFDVISCDVLWSLVRSFLKILWCYVLLYYVLRCFMVSFHKMLWNETSCLEMSGLTLVYVSSSTNMLKSMWTSGYWKLFIHINMFKFLRTKLFKHDKQKVNYPAIIVGILHLTYRYIV